METKAELCLLSVQPQLSWKPLYETGGTGEVTLKVSAASDSAHNDSKGTNEN